MKDAATPNYIYEVLKEKKVKSILIEKELSWLRKQESVNQTISKSP